VKEIAMDFDPRWPDDARDRDRDQGRELSQGSRGGSSDPRERAALDPRDVFMKDLDLPRGPDRERVRVRDHHVTLRGSESRALSTVGASASSLRATCAMGTRRPSNPAMVISGT